MPDDENDDENDDRGAKRLTLLSKHPFLSTLSIEDIDAITRDLPRAQFAPGAVFVHESEPGECAYILFSGTVEILKSLGTPHERSFGLRGPGDIIGEMSLVDSGQPRSASVRAQDAVEALVIDRARFHTLLLGYPRLSVALLGTLSRRLRSSENATIRDLQAKNQELSRAYQELKAAQEQLVEQEVLARELAHAQRIQLQMLPATLPTMPGIDMGAAILAARSVGGDLYEVMRLGADRLAFAIGDVSGKGIPAALYMALVSSLLRSEAREDADPETVVQRVNQHLCERDMESMFVTLLYGEVNLRTRRLRLVRAGHERPLLGAGQHAVAPAGAGRAMPLGLVAEPLLDVLETDLPAGVTLLLYTDGVTDAIDETEAPFGRERLVEIVESNRSLPAQALCDAIVGAVLVHQGAMPQFDDVTVLALHLDSSSPAHGCVEL